jgi:hypothetical protein
LLVRQVPQPHGRRWPPWSLRSPRFEDSNSSANVDIDSKAAGQRTILANIDENLTLLNNGSNADFVPATVPTADP